MNGGNPDLIEFVREKIRQDGPVTFAWFMEQALYHPQFGYYSSGQCQIGRRGDYFTNVSVGPLFGRLLARQFVEMWEIMGRPADFVVVEQGAHHGEFAHDVLTAMSDSPPDLRYCIIEPFPLLQAQQEKTLSEFADKISWRKSVADLERFAGVHFSNELIDSMPIRLIRRERGGDWQEKFVDNSGDNFAFAAMPIADAELRSHLEKIPRNDNDIYETEVNLGALKWIEGIAAKMTRGFVLTVDYGYPRPEFYATERTAGTLQSFAKHRRASSPLDDVGHVDITAHVDWTSVAERGEESGLNLIAFTDQHHFMTGLLAKHSPQENEGRALQTLLHPEFLGTRFQYLGLSRNLPPVQLSGFRFARNPRQTLGLTKNER